MEGMEGAFGSSQEFAEAETVVLIVDGKARILKSRQDILLIEDVLQHALAVERGEA